MPPISSPVHLRALVLRAGRRCFIWPHWNPGEALRPCERRELSLRQRAACNLQASHRLAHLFLTLTVRCIKAAHAANQKSGNDAARGEGYNAGADFTRVPRRPRSSASAKFPISRAQPFHPALAWEPVPAPALLEL